MFKEVTHAYVISFCHFSHRHTHSALLTRSDTKSFQTRTSEACTMHEERQDSATRAAWVVWTHRYVYPCSHQTPDHRTVRPPDRTSSPNSLVVVASSAAVHHVHKAHARQKTSYTAYMSPSRTCTRARRPSSPLPETSSAPSATARAAKRVQSGRAQLVQGGASRLRSGRWAR